MLEWLTKKRKQFTKAIRGRFDSAVTTPSNARHWGNADGLSPTASITPAVQQTLRNRARYEFLNNSYANGIVTTLANDVVGTGPRLQIMTEDRKTNQRIEAAWLRWSKEIDLSGKLRLLRMALAHTGEGFAILTTNPSLSTEIKLDVRLVEADRVTSPSLVGIDQQPVDGIRFDEFGNPTEYDILTAHPGETSLLGLGDESKPYSADSVIHYFRPLRPGQYRGIPELTPALHLFAQLRRYTLAVLGAAETAADYAGILYTDTPADGEATSLTPLDSIELEMRSLLTMPEGWKMAQMKAEQPITSYTEFVRQILNEIARCLNMPFNVAAGNSSGYNYASGRLDHQTYHKSVRVDRSHLDITVLDRIFNSWMDEASLLRSLGSGLGSFDAWPHVWMWDGAEHVDPLKEANAQTKRLESNTTTLAAEYAKQGLDWESQLRQRAKEKKLIEELGLVGEVVNAAAKDYGLQLQDILDEIADKSEVV